MRSHTNHARNIGAALLTLASLGLGMAARPAGAQGNPVLNDPTARRFLGGFLSIGGYFQFSSSGRNAIGDPKFYSDSAFYVRPAHLGHLLLTGGVELMSATDHFLPFTGGNQFELIGPSFAVTTKRELGRPRPFLSGGLFAGRVRSERQGFDRTDFTPSISLGVEWPVARYITLVAGVRFSEEIHGVNTDGFNLSLRIF